MTPNRQGQNCADSPTKDTNQNIFSRDVTKKLYLFDRVDTLQPFEIVGEVDFVSFGCIELTESIG